jgi:beta-barrel assembly-enhancing protease
MKMALPWKWIGFLFLLYFLAGCADAVRLGTTVGAGTGQISKEDKERLDRLALQTERAARPMTDQEEYYLGRAVAATILGQYRIYPNDRLTRYLNEIGQSLALASDRPFTFGGYRFAVLDSTEINALSSPGGIVLVTRGMLLKTQSEEELAAILAHEIGHVSNRDGSKAIQQARWMEVITLLGTEAAKKAGGAEVTKLVSLFEGSVQDVVKTLLVKGYSREQEGNADQSALVIMQRLGYDPNGLVDFLGRLSREQSEGRKQGLLTTHPGMIERASQARSWIVSSQWVPRNHSERDRRFQQVMQTMR